MRTTEEIFKALAEEFSELSGTALLEGGDMWLRLKAVAAELMTLEGQAEFVARQSFPQTATGTFLDKHAQLRGLNRGEALKAEGVLRFYLNSSVGRDLTVPAGTECMTGAGTAFVTLAEATLPAGQLSCDVWAEAVEAGTGGNVPMGSIVYIKLMPAGIAGVMNPAPFSGGSEGENDDELRERVLASYSRLPNGANVAYYESAVMEVPGVASVLVQPKKRGIGTVDIIISGEEGTPAAQLLEQVRETLNAQREICVDISVQAPETVSVDVEAAIYVSEGYNFDTVKADAEEAIRSLFGGRMLGKSVYRARLGAALMAVEGLENYILTAPERDIVASEEQLTVLDKLVISEAV